MNLMDISRIKYVSLGDLVPDPANARRHNDRNVEEVARALREFGQHSPLVVQRSTNRIIVGNCRFEAMQSLGWDKAAVYFVDDDNVQAVRRALSDNRTAELAEWDDGVLSTLLRELDASDDLDVPGWDDAELEAMLGGVGPVDLDEEGKPKDKGEGELIHCPKCGFQFEV